MPSSCPRALVSCTFPLYWSRVRGWTSRPSTALYEAMPPGTRAELIGGVVHMPSPVGHAHGRAQVPVIVWLDYYAENTPGVEVLDNATTILGWKSEPQPDVMLRVLPECGGRTQDQKGFVQGAPELVVEVARATRYVRPRSKADRLRTRRSARVPRACAGAGRDPLVRTAARGRSLKSG